MNFDAMRDGCGALGAQGSEFAAISLAAFLVARVHEGAAAALRAEIGIGDRRAAVFGIESAREARIGLELWGAAVKLPSIAQHHPRASVHGLYRSADMHVHVFVLSKLADIIAIFPETHDGEAARVVGWLRRAYIEETRPIGQFHHVEDMGGDADIFVEELRRLIGGNAGLCAGEGQAGQSKN
jgi:hypothetical protein